ncbi:hypothetical protein BST61_g7154 [Cercospora zeina]
MSRIPAEQTKEDIECTFLQIKGRSRTASLRDALFGITEERLSGSPETCVMLWTGSEGVDEPRGAGGAATLRNCSAVLENCTLEPSFGRDSTGIGRTKLWVTTTTACHIRILDGEMPISLNWSPKSGERVQGLRTIPWLEISQNCPKETVAHRDRSLLPIRNRTLLTIKSSEAGEAGYADAGGGQMMTRRSRGRCEWRQASTAGIAEPVK